MKVKILNVSTWKRDVHINTSGTRDKNIITCPKGKKYFFKKSFKRGNRYYRYEFWSEVIASKIGALFGFNVVKYHVAYFGNEIGCISESVIGASQEHELKEGFGYIVERYPYFQESFKKSHSFQKINGALKSHKLDFLFNEILNMVVFDAIIGNTDRHSENWAIITSNRALKEVISDLENMAKIKKMKLRIRLFLYSKGRVSLPKVVDRLRKNIFRFSPLYDNGSSLARELDDVKIQELLRDEVAFLNFINRGKSDIRWNERQLNHFSLTKTLKLDYPNEVGEILNRIKEGYNKNKIKSIVQNIDSSLPSKFNEYKIPQSRKDFIIKYIYTRIDILLNIDNYEHI